MVVTTDTWGGSPDSYPDSSDGSGDDGRGWTYSVSPRTPDQEGRVMVVTTTGTHTEPLGSYPSHDYDGNDYGTYGGDPGSWIDG